MTKRARALLIKWITYVANLLVHNPAYEMIDFALLTDELQKELEKDDEQED